jgi:O-antigen ligase
MVLKLLRSRDGLYFWQAPYIWRWFPLLLGLGLGVVVAFLLVNEMWHFAVPLILAVPAIILFTAYPFTAVVLWMLILPYFLNEPTSAGRFIYWLVHRAMPPIALGTVILSDWFGIRKRRPVSFGRAEFFMLILLGWALASTYLFSPNPIQTTIVLYDTLFIPFCMYWLIRLVAPAGEDLKRFLWVAAITVLAQCAIGLLGWFAPDVLPSKWLTGLEGARTVGSLKNAAVYTSTLLFLSLLLFQYAMQTRSSVVRLTLLLVFSLAIYLVFMSFSKGSWLGASVVMAGLLVLYPKTIVRMLVILVTLVYLLSSSLLAWQIAWAYERTVSEEATRSIEDRIVANNASIEMIKARPLFGWGFHNYDRYDRDFQSRVGNISVRYDVTSHNTYLTILAELGIAGFFVYMLPQLWWAILTLKAWKRLPRRGFWSRKLLVMMWLLLMHMAIAATFMDMIRFHHFANTIWWMALALIASMVHDALQGDSVDTAFRTV